MISIKNLFGSVLLVVLLILVQAEAASHSRAISVQVIAKENITLKGSIITQALATVTLADLQQKKRINLGTFGIEASTRADCSIQFSSANNYRLQHVAQKNRYLMAYKLNYNGQLIDSSTKIKADCRAGNGTLTLIPSHSIAAAIPQGAYQDKLRIVVTTP